jgi:outer membrane protein assembly factor BamB
MGNLRVAISLVLIMLISTLAACGGGGGIALQPGAGATASSATGSQALPGAAGGTTAIAPPLPVAGMPLPPSPNIQAATPAQQNALSGNRANLGAFHMPADLPGTIPPKPADVNQAMERAAAKGASATKSASDLFLNPLDPYTPVTLYAHGQFVPPYGGPCYDYRVSPTLNAQHLSAGNTELHVWGSVINSNVQEMIYAQIGLVTEPVYQYAMQSNIPSYMFNQNVSMMNALTGANPFLAPLDFNGNLGMGRAQYYGPATGYDFDLKLVPDQRLRPWPRLKTDRTGTGGLCWLRIRPHTNPISSWTAYSGDPSTPALGYPYGIDNWGGNDWEDFSSARILAQIYSYNPNQNIVGSITFQGVRETEGALTGPIIDCRALTDARFFAAGPGADGTQNTPDDVALTGWCSTNTQVNLEPVLTLGDKFYVSFDHDPAQVNDITLYPSIPVTGMVQYTTLGLVADPALAAYFELPDTAPGGKVYSQAHPFVLTLRTGAYNRITNDLRSISWANYQLQIYPGSVNLTAARPTNASHLDRVIFAQGVQYNAVYSSLAYPEAGSYYSSVPPFLGYGAAELIYPAKPGGCWTLVGYNVLSEMQPVIGGFYDANGLTNTLQSDAYCRFEARTNWAGTNYGFVDEAKVLIAPIFSLDPSSQPWNTFAFLRGTQFYMQTADVNKTLTVTVAPNKLLSDSLHTPTTLLPFSATGYLPPHNGEFRVITVRIFDDPAQPDPCATVTANGDGWDVDINFLLQYGGTSGIPPAPDYYVQFDGDWGGSWDDGLPGRTQPLLPDPSWEYTSPGLKTRIVHISSAVQPAGYYHFAIRVVTATGMYTYVWPTTVTLGGGAGDWCMFGHDAQHTHRSQVAGPATNALAWQYSIVGGNVTTAPASGADGTVYIGSDNGNIYAINADGSPKWTYITGGIILSSPAIGADGVVIVGNENYNLYAINPNGSLKWSYTTGNSITLSSPVIGTDGTVYIGCTDQNLYAINPDGSLKWAYYTGFQIKSSPAIGADGTVYVGSEFTDLHAINPDGSLKWSYATGGPVDSSPAIGADGTVYVGSDDNKLYAINPSGSLQWTYTLASDINFVTPAIAADGTIYMGCSDSNLYAINPDGSLKWTYATGDAINGAPAIGLDGIVYVGSDDTTLYAIYPNGSVAWSDSTGAGLYFPPALGNDGTLYVGRGSTLYAF